MATPLACEPSLGVNGVDPVFVMFAEAAFPGLLFAFLFNLLLLFLLWSWACQGLPQWFSFLAFGQRKAFPLPRSIAQIDVHSRHTPLV